MYSLSPALVDLLRLILGLQPLVFGCHTAATLVCDLCRPNTSLVRRLFFVTLSAATMSIGNFMNNLLLVSFLLRVFGEREPLFISIWFAVQCISISFVICWISFILPLTFPSGSTVVEEQYQPKRSFFGLLYSLVEDPRLFAAIQFLGVLCGVGNHKLNSFMLSMFIETVETEAGPSTAPLVGLGLGIGGWWNEEAACIASIINSSVLMHIGFNLFVKFFLRDEAFRIFIVCLSSVGLSLNFVSTGISTFSNYHRRVVAFDEGAMDYSVINFDEIAPYAVVAHSYLCYVAYAFGRNQYQRQAEAELLDLKQSEIDSLNQRVEVGRLNEKIQAAAKEQALVQSVLANVLPKKIADTLSQGQPVPPVVVPFVCVFFSDIKGFTAFAAENGALKVFEMLDTLYTVMDYCLKQFGGTLYKVETVGDAYMVVAGLPFISDEAPSSESSLCHLISQFALLAVKAVKHVPMGDDFVSIRVGLHCGDVVTGITGNLTPQFCVFGDTVNTASRMETTSQVDHIHCSDAFATCLAQFPNSSAIYRLNKLKEPLDVKGKGLMQTHFISARGSVDELYRAELREVQELVSLKASVSKAGLSLIKFMQDSRTSDGMSASADSAPSPGSKALPAVRSWASLQSDCDELDAASSEHEARKPAQLFSEAMLRAFDCDVLKVTSKSPVETIAAAALSVFQCAVDLEAIQVSAATLERLVLRIGFSYKRVPYHNFHHAFCVLQFTLALLSHCEADDQALLPPREVFTVLLTALCHDVNHPGTNNAFQIKSKSPLATRYNDSSVLENHHAALTFAMIRSDGGCNVFEHWPEEETQRARHILVDSILGTDMAVHGKLVEELEGRARRMRCQQGPVDECAAASPDDPVGTKASTIKAYDLSAPADRVHFYRILIHAADIANTVRPFATSFPLALAVCEELASQARMEQELGLDVTQFMLFPTAESVCRGEVGFITRVARPYWVLLGELYPGFAGLVQVADSNAERWQAPDTAGSFEWPPLSSVTQETTPIQ